MHAPESKWSKLAIACWPCVLLALLISITADVIDGWLAVGFFGLLLSPIPLGHTALSDIKKSGGKLRGRYTAIAGTCCGYLCLVFILYMFLTADRHGYMRNESMAVGTLRLIHRSEQSFVNRNKDSGYACCLKELESELKGVLEAGSGDSATRLVDTKTRSGYIFDVHCNDPGRSDYFVTAVPQRPGKSGIRSFCSDAAGEIRYTNDVDGRSCMQEGLPVF